ncbi:MAG: ABC transporter permease, partial [Candidatus Kariarchaeaceae archaeon]
MALRDLLLKRIGQAILTVFVVLVIDFAIFNFLPGNYIDLISQSPSVGGEAIQKMIESFGLNKPLAEQFLIFFSNFIQGNLGFSLWSGEAVLPLMIERLINTLILLLPADIIAITLGIWIGKQSAWRRGSFSDLFGWSLSLITYAIPTFWLGLTFLSVFGVNLQWFPIETYNFMNSITEFEGSPPLEFIEYTILHLTLPLLVLIIAITGVFALIMRNSLLETLSEDYMVTAKAKGRKEQDQLNKEAYPNARIPVATIIAIQIGFSVVGALLTEIVFNYNGIGRLIWESVGRRDYIVLQAAFFMFTIVLIFTNIIADFIYFYLDPRIRVTGPEIRQAKDTDESNRLMTYLFIFIFVVILIIIFTIFENDRPIAFSILNGSIWLLALFHKFLKEKFELELPNPFVFLIISLTVSAVFLFEDNLDLVGLYVILSLAVIIVLKWQILLHFIISFLKKYKISNLKHAWSNNKVQTITNLNLAISLTFLFIIFFTFILDFFLDLLNQYLTIGSFEFYPMILEIDSLLGNIPSLIFFVVLAGLIFGVLVSRSESITSTFNQVLESNKGVFGLILIISFLILAIFGDVLAPFEPQKVGVGSSYMPPTTIFEYQFILLLLCISVFLLILLINTFYKFKESNDMGSGIGILVSLLLLTYIFILILDFLIDSTLKIGLIDSSVYNDIFIMVIYEVIIGIGIFGIINSSKTKTNDSFLKIRKNYLNIGIIGFITLIFSSLYFDLLTKYLDLLSTLLKISYFAAFIVILISISLLLILGLITIAILSLRIIKYRKILEESLEIIKLPSEIKLFFVGIFLIYLSLLLSFISIIRVGNDDILRSVAILYFTGFLLGMSYLIFLRIQITNLQKSRLLIMKYITIIFLVGFLLLMIATFFLFDDDDIPIFFSIILAIFSGVIVLQGLKPFFLDFQISKYKSYSLKIF